MNLIITQPLLFACWLWCSLHGTFGWRKKLPQMNHMFTCWPTPMQWMHDNDWQNEPKMHHDYNSMIIVIPTTGSQLLGLESLPSLINSQKYVALNWRPWSIKQNTTSLKHFPLGLDTVLVIKLVRSGKEERSTLVLGKAFKKWCKFKHIEITF